MTASETQILRRPGLPDLAWMSLEGTGPTLVWLSGFHSDMTGTKVAHLSGWAAARRQGFVAFDYRGHGRSDGRFEDGTISDWLADALAIIDTVTSGPIILVGSSMGGWLSLLAARARPTRVAGLVLIAPAPDFTERLMWRRFERAVQKAIEQDGFWMRPSAYGDDPYPITRALIEDGRRHLLLDHAIPIEVPVRILHGQRDADVPWALSLDLATALAAPDVQVTFVKDGDHRLSTPSDLSLLTRTIEALVAQLRF